MEEKVYPGEIDLDIIPLPEGSLVSHLVENTDSKIYQVSTRTKGLSLNEIMGIVDALVTMVSNQLETDRIDLVAKMFIRETEKLLTQEEDFEKIESNFQLVETYIYKFVDVIDRANLALDMVKSFRRMMGDDSDEGKGDWPF